MACCGTGCRSKSCGGCGGGYGGRYGDGGAGAGAGSVLVDTGSTSSMHVQCGGPHLISHCDPKVCCSCVCTSECCAPCCTPCCGFGGYGGYGGGRGGQGPGMRVDICFPGYDAILPAGFLCSSIHCGQVDTSCCHDPCCSPC